MKKKAVIITIVSVFLLIAVILLVNRNHDLRIIYLNWNITFPTNCKELYQIDSGASFLGDGQRYHVFKYDTNITLNDFISEQIISESDKERILDILSALNVKKDFYPYFGNITYATMQKQNDHSTLYLCYSMSQRTLYVIEDIY